MELASLPSTNLMLNKHEEDWESGQHKAGSRVFLKQKQRYMQLCRMPEWKQGHVWSACSCVCVSVCVCVRDRTCMCKHEESWAAQQWHSSGFVFQTARLWSEVLSVVVIRARWSREEEAKRESLNVILCRHKGPVHTPNISAFLTFLPLASAFLPT